MINIKNWDKNLLNLFEVTLDMMDHLDDSSGDIRINTYLISNPQELLDYRYSNQVVAKVMENMCFHFLGQQPPSKFLKLLNRKYPKDLRAYVSTVDILRIWDLPICSIPEISLEEVESKVIGSTKCYRWENLIDHIGDKPGMENFSYLWI